MTPASVRIAAAQYPIEEITSFGAFEAKLTRWVYQRRARVRSFLSFPNTRPWNWRASPARMSAAI